MEGSMKKYLSVIPLLLLVCFVVGCQDKEALAELEEFKAQAALEEQNKALVMRYSEARSKGDIEAIKELVSSDYVWHISGGHLSLEESIESLKQQMAMLTDRTIIAQDVIVKGDKVVTRYIFRGTHEMDTEGIPATGNTIEVNGIKIVRVEDGKIVESWEVPDALAYALQLGFELKLKEGEK
jgi:steroid delta-isomerase-like uncharacterized protein